MMRIDKYLAEMGQGTRSEIKKLIRSGRVMVDGETVKKPELKIDETTQKVSLDGKQIGYAKKEYYMLHKPAGVISATKDDRDKTVLDLITDKKRNDLFPVGRLDKDSEGLLLLTNQGDLVNRIMRAGNYHEKEYEVTVDKKITETFIRKMSSGVPILGTVTRSCTVYKTGDKSFSIILTQGLNRQIRRMCEYLGYHVCTLKRIRIMNLTLDGLKCGEYREICGDEWKKLNELIRDSSSETVIRTGGQHGNISGRTNKRTGAEAERSGKGILSGRPGDHEQQRVRRTVRSTGKNGKGNRNRPGRQPNC